MPKSSSTFFAPQLIIKDCAAAITFYEQAFGIKELQRWSNDDGSVHVAELSFDDAIFHIHEPTKQYQLNAETANPVTVIMGVFVDDPHAVAKHAVAAGARELSPVQDYEYNYRQGTVIDPFGHHWLIEKKLKEN
ncbi:VOC family protein [Parafilimonas sp.]|uniref:VOC family protein n=1 Tax=Parafilimonas sp. TaxID=1969739 RepID=UPI0039E58270